MVAVHRRRQDVIEDLPDGEEVVVLEDRLQRPAAPARLVVRGLEDGNGERQQPHRSPVAFTVAQVAVVAGRYDAGKAARLLDQRAARQDVGIFVLDREPLGLEKKRLAEALGRDDDGGALVVRLEEGPYFRIGMEQIGTKTQYVFGIHLARVDDPRLHRCHHYIALFNALGLIVSQHQREASPSALMRRPPLRRATRTVSLRTASSMGRAHPNSQCLRPTQAGVADNVGGQDRRQFALLTGHGTLPQAEL